MDKKTEVKNKGSKPKMTNSEAKATYDCDMDLLNGTIGYRHSDIVNGVVISNYCGKQIGFKSFSEFNGHDCKCGERVYRHESNKGENVYCFNCGRKI